MDFNSELGMGILKLIKYWQDIGDNPEHRLYVVWGRNPQLSKATITEKKMLTSIKEKATKEQWDRLDKLFEEAEEYISDKNIRKMNEYNLLLNQTKTTEEKSIKEKTEIREEHWLKAVIEEKENRKQKQKEEENKKRKEEEKKRRKEENEKNKGYKELEKLLNNNFLGSRQIWLNKLSIWMKEDEYSQLLVRFVINWFEKQGWLKPDEEQALCIAEVWDDIQVIARAGSGKTSTIVNRAAFLIKHCEVSPSEILLLAFNREAAKEVNDRLHKLLGDKAPQAMTFHALAYALVHPEEALIYDDETNGLMKSSTVQQVIDSFIRNTSWSERIQDLMIKYFRSSWEDFIKGGYNLAPKEMVEYRRSLPYIGLDGKYYKSKGEKKIADYLFEHDIPYKYEKNFWWDGRNYKPDFTIPLNKNLKAMVIEYFGKSGDSEYDKQTKDKINFWESKSDYGFIELYPGQADSKEILDQYLGSHLLSYGFKVRRFTDIEIWHRIKDRAIDEFSSVVSQFIGRCRKGMISPETLVDKFNNDKSLSNLHVDFLRVVIKVYQEYLQILSINSEEDFEGLLVRAEEVVKAGKSYWKRKAGSGDLKSVKYLFIDEYQDFSLLFYRLILSIKNINSDIKVFCVGDNWQAINGFAGSDLDYFTNFKDYFKEGKTLEISSNYRSDRKIIRIGNRLMHSFGPPSKPVRNEEGEVGVAWIDDFKPNVFEERKYVGDLMTPMLIRLVYSYIQKGQRVALLCRRRNGLPWYTPYESARGKFHDKLLSAIRDALPEESRPMVVAIDTTHSYKGKEEDAIIIVDAVMRSYPLLHPRNVLFQILGQTWKDVIDEEQRLFYVALSRAKKSLIVVTEHNEESPFLSNLLQYSIYLNTVNVNRLQCPNGEGTHYIVSIGNNYYQKNGTYEIKSYLQENKYCWNSERRVWVKHFSSDEFSKEKLLEESWSSKAKNITVSVTDEFDRKIVQIGFEDGIVTIKDFDGA